MSRDYLTTSQIARQVGVHPNTVRMYESWGFLSPIPRDSNGYRKFSPLHLDQMRVARRAFACTWLGGEVRRAALAMVQASAAGELQAALAEGRRMDALVQAERDQAEAAAEYLEHWASGKLEPDPTALLADQHQGLTIGQAAKLLSSTVDALRNWERNGLIRTPRDRHNGYRRYGPAEIGRLRVIRMLLQSGYSIMAILRMMIVFDQGRTTGLRQVLDTPRPDEDILYVSDRLLATLAEMKGHSAQAVVLLEGMVAKYRA